MYGGFKPFFEDPVKPVNLEQGGWRHRARAASRGRARQRLAGASPEHAAGRSVAGKSLEQAAGWSGAGAGGRPEQRRSGRPEFEFVHACVTGKKKREEKTKEKNFYGTGLWDLFHPMPCGTVNSL